MPVCMIAEQLNLDEGNTASMPGATDAVLRFGERLHVPTESESASRMRMIEILRVQRERPEVFQQDLEPIFSHPGVLP